jgi:hypothetical protein
MVRINRAGHLVSVLLEDRWVTATKIETTGYRYNWELLTSVPREFPRLADGSPDWFGEAHAAEPKPPFKKSDDASSS